MEISLLTFLKLVASGFRKAFKLEFRTRYAVNAILLFAVIALSAVSFAVGPQGINERLGASFFWVVLFFSAMSGLSHIFVREIEQKTDLLLKLYLDTSIIFWSKFLFNIVLLFLLELVIVPLFFFWFQLEIHFILLFFTSLFLGTIGLATVSTLVAGMIAQTGSKSALFAVLSFPILLPLIIIGIKITSNCFLGIRMDEIISLHLTLLSYDGVMLIVSPFLFKYIWRS